jgi:hypothetical protein
MSRRPLLAALLLAALPVCAFAQTPQPPQTPQNTPQPKAPRPLPGVPATAHAVPLSQSEGGYHRIGLPGSGDQPFPYTVEVPTGWAVKESKESPGLWLGPADAVPPKDPRLVYVRISLNSLDDPEKAAANIRASDKANDAWTAPRVEVRDLEGVKGVLVRMDSGAGDAARSTLALKLPLDKGGVDFMASAARAEFDKLLPTYERILLSVRRRPS